MEGTIKVAVVCDNEIFGRGLAASLREDPGVVVGTGRTPLDAPVDVAVVSPSVLSKLACDCPVLVCTDVPFDVTTVDISIAGILPRRQLTPDQLLYAVKAAAAGLRVGLLPTPSNALAARTVDVLRLIAEGAGTREISDELGYSERTIKSVIAGAVRDLGARNRTHAIAEAMRRAII